MFILVPFLGIFVAIGSFMVGLGFRTKAGFPDPVRRRSSRACPC